jgi:hypothetical protein
VTIILSHIAALNPYNSLNTFRATDGYRFNETRLQQISPSSKENMINAYNGELGIPHADAFEKHVEDYLKIENDALKKQLGNSVDRTTDQNATYDKLVALQTELTNELVNFTDKVTKLPANTHAETLASVAKEEQAIILAKIKVLNKETLAFTQDLTPKTRTDTAKAGAAAAGSAMGTAGAGTTAAGTAAPATVATKPLIDASAAKAAKAALSALSDTSDNAEDKALKELGEKLTDTITNMERAATLERGRIPLFAVLVGNQRRQNLFTSTINSMKEPFSLFSSTKASPFSVLSTGADQKGVKRLRDAMQHLALTGQDQKALDEARANLQKAETGLEKAKKRDEKADNTDEIKKYNDEIKKYNEEIAEQQKKIAAGAEKAAQELQGKEGRYFGLVGYDPGLTALSGKKITVTANDQGLGFALNFPAPILDPNYWSSSEHNTKADLVCLAELVKATGAKTITTTIKSGMFPNPERELMLAQEAWEAALEVGFEEDKITIKMGNKTFTKENLKDLYEDLDKQSGKETGKHAGKQERAKSFQETAANARADAATKSAKNAPKEIEQQQKVFKDAMAAGRNNLEKLAPTPPSESAAPPTASI